MLLHYDDLMQAKSRLYKILTTLALILSIMGVVTFSLFILEESFQTVMFGTWPAQDAQRWDLVKAGTEHMRRIETTTKFVNRWFGWIQPFAFVSYGAYADSMDFYIEALRAKAIAHAPELFIGERVQFEFQPKSAKPTSNGMMVTGGAITILCRKEQYQNMMKIDGVLEHIDGKILVDIR